MGPLGHLARPLTPNSGAKALVFLGRDNGLPWNAALDVRVGSDLEGGDDASHVGSSPASRHRVGYVVVRLGATSRHRSPVNGLTTIESPPNSRAFTRAVGPQASANQLS